MDKNILEFWRARNTKLEQLLQSPGMISQPQKLPQLSVEYKELQTKLEHAEKILSLQQAVTEAQQTITSAADQELVELAKQELPPLEKQLQTAEAELQILLLPKDAHDDKNIIVEIRAGAGGDESALFAADLLRMYTRYAENKKWPVEIISSHHTGIGGFKEAIMEIRGAGAYADFKYEMGVHRVQRVPKTEKSGRVHTSTVTVAVLPEAEEVDLKIEPSDLRIDVFRSSGHGGQSVNTTDSAVRITHLPSGLVVSCQDEKSQHKNKAKALKILRARLLAQKEEAEQKQRGDERRAQVGTGDRAEKIRTYNFPQDRITDHRINRNWNNIQTIIDGACGEMIAALQAAEKQAQLAALHLQK